MEDLQAAKNKIALQHHDLKEHQHKLDTLQAKIVSASNCHSKHEFSRGQHGHDTTDTKHAHKLPGCTQEGGAHGVYRSDRSLREYPTSTSVRQHGQRKPRRRRDVCGYVEHSEKPATEREDSRRDAAVDIAATAWIRHEICEVVHQPLAKRCMSSAVFAIANITSADPRQSTADRTVGLNCTGRMTELEAQFSATGFHVVAVQEGRMPSRTVLSGNTCRMHVLEGVGNTHSLGLQMWVHKSLTAALEPVTVVSPRVMCLNLKMRDKCDTTRNQSHQCPRPSLWF